MTQVLVDLQWYFCVLYLGSQLWWWVQREFCDVNACSNIIHALAHISRRFLPVLWSACLNLMSQTWQRIVQESDNTKSCWKRIPSHLIVENGVFKQIIVSYQCLCTDMISLRQLTRLPVSGVWGAYDPQAQVYTMDIGGESYTWPLCRLADCGHCHQ